MLRHWWSTSPIHDSTIQRKSSVVNDVNGFFLIRFILFFALEKKKNPKKKKLSCFSRLWNIDLLVGKFEKHQIPWRVNQQVNIKWVKRYEMRVLRVIDLFDSRWQINRPYRPTQQQEETIEKQQKRFDSKRFSLNWKQENRFSLSAVNQMLEKVSR